MIEECVDINRKLCSTEVKISFAFKRRKVEKGALNGGLGRRAQVRKKIGKFRLH